MSIKIALVGAGHMGRIHLGKLIELEDVEVLGVVDVDRNALDNVYKNHRLPIYEDYKNISDIIDGVVISSPTESHYEMAKYFLERGVHVFIEKPITTEIAQGKELVEISDKLNLVLQIGLLERFNPAIKEAMKHIERPLFIEARRMSSFTGRSTDIDVVLDMMIHDIDLTLSVVKDDVYEIQAYGMPFVSDKLDMASAWIKFSSGCTACITASRVSVNRERSFAIYESKKRYFVDLLSGRLTGTVIGYGGGVDTFEYEADKVDSVKEELLEFISSISGGKKPRISGKEGVNALVIAEKIKKIAANKS
ncbi:MAG TPA: Gfo/Idh/MocA family oxidoreductase [Syntrophorhabdaceae bacterium]|jgi:predicted dehydrogenase|nr:Gfo/Idh/MocA family oxidoreductase [Syntrophorhabdaceae bacterium]HOS04927.1 Gfo/Idh/MocA family oxidoreductase [Syntrophorhabdaceae bacterium]HPL40247.1 Gfo/Idh/MocA family oxidoreductase [Syntrophorhabdaceae bacterium]